MALLLGYLFEDWIDIDRISVEIGSNNLNLLGYQSISKIVYGREKNFYLEAVD
jgi:hypothetical protein